MKGKLAGAQRHRQRYMRWTLRDLRHLHRICCVRAAQPPSTLWQQVRIHDARRRPEFDSTKLNQEREWNKQLMDAADDVPGVEHRDGALDGTPVAEMHDIAEVSALVGTVRGFQLRIFAELSDQIRRLGEGGTAGDVNIFLQATTLMLCARPSK
jgi:hypothetical protein